MFTQSSRYLLGGTGEELLTRVDNDDSLWIEYLVVSLLALLCCVIALLEGMWAAAGVDRPVD